jgi:hypothetical protein
LSFKSADVRLGAGVGASIVVILEGLTSHRFVGDGTDPEMMPKVDPRARRFMRTRLPSPP